MSGKMICPDCNGSGFLEEEKKCTSCDNTGEIEINEENLEIFFEINSSRLQ